MKKASVIICALVFIVLLFTGNASAIGLGMYINFGGGTGEAEFDVRRVRGI